MLKPTTILLEGLDGPEGQEKWVEEWRGSLLDFARANPDLVKASCLILRLRALGMHMIGGGAIPQTIVRLVRENAA